MTVYEDILTSDHYVIVSRGSRSTIVRNLRTGKTAIWGNSCVRDDLFRTNKTMPVVAR